MRLPGRGMNRCRPRPTRTSMNHQEQDISRIAPLGVEGTETSVLAAPIGVDYKLERRRCDSRSPPVGQVCPRAKAVHENLVVDMLDQVNWAGDKTPGCNFESQQRNDEN